MYKDERNNAYKIPKPQSRLQLHETLTRDRFAYHVDNGDYRYYREQYTKAREYLPLYMYPLPHE